MTKDRKDINNFDKYVFFFEVRSVIAYFELNCNKTKFDIYTTVRLHRNFTLSDKLYTFR